MLPAEGVTPSGVIFSRLWGGFCKVRSDLLCMGQEDLRKISGVGEITIKFIKEYLSEWGSGRLEKGMNT